MICCILQYAPSRRALFFVAGFLLPAFFVVMDILLYDSLLNTTLLDQERDKVYSPFHPLTMKLVMTDHITHYVLNPFAEYFNSCTQFSEIHCVVPNVISVAGLCLGLISGTFISSGSLRDRRIGVLLYEVRLLFDVLDGVVFRSQTGITIYKSHRGSFGYFVDAFCDTVSGIALCLGIYFCLWNCPPPARPNGALPSESLPSTKPTENNTVTQVHIENSNGRASKKYMFFKVLCFGILLTISAFTWDTTVEMYSSVLQTKLTTPVGELMQTRALHSTSTWIVIWLWRVCEGQALLQMVLISIFIDKIWEFLNFIQYTGFIVLAALNIFSRIHLLNIKESIATPFI